MGLGTVYIDVYAAHSDSNGTQYQSGYELV